MATPSASTAIELLRSHSLTTVVHRELERRILAGELAPGDKLNEADLAAELNVSRGPVREAFRALEQAGLVRTEKNRGVFVRQVSVEEADEIYEVRAGLDEMIGRLAAERATAEEVDELKDMVKRMQQVARSKDVAAYYPMNVRFHDRLAEVSGNKTLAATYRRLVNELHLYRRETLARGANSFPISTREHAQIVDAIARGDAEEAGVLLREHAMQSRDRLHATIVKKGKVTK